MEFERGPIRPPSESRSLLLRVIRNCPWNKCTFCPVYKGRTFSRRSLAEIKRDIDAVRTIIERLKELEEFVQARGGDGRAALNAALTDPGRTDCQRMAALWYFRGQGSVFLQDADVMLLSTEMLVKVLNYLKRNVPGIRRITCYARSGPIARKSAGELREIREAGLTRVHVGLESGSDAVLKRVRKGATAAKHVDAGRKVAEAGLELSEYVMPGLGGAEYSREHAVETARVLNAIDPDFIRLRSLVVPDRAPLYHEMQEGAFNPVSDDEAVREIRLLIESLEGIHSHLQSDHIINLLQDVEGRLPDDKDAMLNKIDHYLALPERDRLLYRLGRRGGALRSPDDLRDPSMRARLQRALDDLEADTGLPVETAIAEYGARYI
jgi:hypothetical protein